MPQLLLDTHTWLFLEMGERRRIPPYVQRQLERGFRSGSVSISAISIWELGVLTRQRITLTKPLEEWITDAIGNSNLYVHAVDERIALRAARLPGSFRSDPADHLIVATALVTGATLVTADTRIQEYAEQGFLKVLAL